MLKRGLALSLVLALVLAVGTGIAVYTQEEEVPAIPGITAEDSHPNGCVGCHKPRPDIGQDFRLSKDIKAWATDGAPEEVMEVAEASWPGVELTGTHPDVAQFVRNQSMPESCLTCHGDKSSIPLDDALHSYHFAGGGENTFVNNYDGRCLQCHSMNADVANPPTGIVGMKSGMEIQPDENGEGENGGGEGE